MNKKLGLILFSAISALIFCSSTLFDNDTDLCKSFVQLLNNQKSEDAKVLCSDSLKVNYKYSNITKRRVEFFTYLRKNEKLNQQLLIDSTQINNGKVNVYCKSRNNFNQYLKLHQLPIRYSFLVKNNLIYEINIDSLKGYNDSLKINDRRWLFFEKWIKTTHQSINLYYIKLQYPDSLTTLAKEFYDSAVKK